MKKLPLLPLVSSVSIGILVLFGAFLFNQSEKANYFKQIQEHSEKHLLETSANLSQAMNVRLTLTKSLAAFVATNRDFTEHEFDLFASIMQNKMDGITSLQLAPNGVVRYLTNLESNRKALGHDLFADERRRPVVEKSKREKRYIISGPVNLIQGGQAIIARRPLYYPDKVTNNEIFWGFATILIDLDILLTDARFTEMEQDFIIAIRGKDGLGEKGAVFYGDATVFEEALFIADVVLPDALWQMAAIMKPQHNEVSFIFSYWYWLLSSLMSFIFIIVSFSLINRPRVLRERIFLATENLRTTLNSIGDAVIATDTEQKIVQLNPVAEKLTGYSFKEALGQPLSMIFRIINADSRDIIDDPVSSVLTTGKSVGFGNQIILLERSGKEYSIADSAAPILSKAGEVTGVILIFRDISQEIKLQTQLNQRDKMNAIGELGGGVAHDFNNILTAIQGAAQLLNYPVHNLDEKCQKYVKMILDASERGASLTTKLLAFGRKRAITSTSIDIHEIINDEVAIFQQTIDKRIDIKVDLSAEMHLIKGEYSAIQNALMNLGINASQAMEQGGEIVISTSNTFLTEKYCSNSSFDIKPGNYIDIGFSDSGEGIKHELIHKIFDPFFTTKKQEKGTGLGLSTVYGTILSHNGAITVSSVVGVGTSFHLYLPCLDIDTDVVSRKTHQETINGNGEMILLVDDEEIIRLTCTEMLQSMGYEVLTAENGRKAVDLYKIKYQEIELVIMDMMMPDMNGKDAFYKMKEINENCKVIISSGFSKEEWIHKMKKDGLNGYLKKPYLKQDLSQKICEVLSQ